MFTRSLLRVDSLKFIKNAVGLCATIRNDSKKILYFSLRRDFICSSVKPNFNENKLLQSEFGMSSNFLSQNKFLSTDFEGNNKNDKESINIGEGSWEEVYRGVLTAQFKLLKMFSIGTSVLGLCMQPILYEQIGNANLGLVVAFGSFIGFFTFASPCLIHFISKKYVTKLEYDPKSDVYAATTLSFFLKEKKIHFKADDVTQPSVPGMFTSFVVKNKALFVDPNQFEDVDHYSRLMGYDKPIDFRPDSEKNNN